jgi:hypothetical protein
MPRRAKTPAVTTAPGRPIDLATETGLRPRDAARLIPPLRQRAGADGITRPVPTHLATIVRWITNGAPAGPGRRVKLRAVRLPSGWVTTARAVREFLDAINGDANP